MRFMGFVLVVSGASPPDGIARQRRTGRIRLSAFARAFDLAATKAYRARKARSYEVLLRQRQRLLSLDPGEILAPDRFGPANPLRNIK